MFSYTNEDILKKYKELSEMLNRPATYDDITKHTGITPYLIRERFKSLENVRELTKCNLQSMKYSITKEQICKILYKYYKLYNRKLDAIEINNIPELPYIKIMKKICDVESINGIWEEVYNIDKMVKSQTEARYTVDKLIEKLINLQKEGKGNYKIVNKLSDIEIDILDINDDEKAIKIE